MAVYSRILSSYSLVNTFLWKVVLLAKEFNFWEKGCDPLGYSRSKHLSVFYRHQSHQSEILKICLDHEPLLFEILLLIYCSSLDFFQHSAFLLKVLAPAVFHRPFWHTFDLCVGVNLVMVFKIGIMYITCFIQFKKFRKQRKDMQEAEVNKEIQRVRKVIIQFIVQFL